MISDISCITYLMIKNIVYTTIIKIFLDVLPLQLVAK